MGCEHSEAKTPSARAGALLRTACVVDTSLSLSMTARGKNSGFRLKLYRLPRSFLQKTARNDGYFHSKRFQNFEKFSTKVVKMMNST